ncbi:MAG TPA: preprotein translocase subunit SecG [Candidatus Ornithospirochaeta avicola]|uniref:Protein-export membrane protein SecG n=1 Tax=Candidatus Ornithospirochaeta avicola TaxID=2840896 RepID=A0A9D1PRR4_9SPIO|nr:preprotein translocase subunit SecG [Candidatus Ornithospirochaeta avicola]
MTVLGIILLVLFVLVALLLVFLVAIQSEQSTGLGGVFGGDSSTAFGGRSNAFLTKATTILAILFLVLALLVALTHRTGSEDLTAAVEQTQRAEAGTTWLTNDSQSEVPASDSAN